MKSSIKFAVAAPLLMLIGMQVASAAEWYCAYLPFLCQAPSVPSGGPQSVPEPGTLALLAAGVTVYGARLLRRSRK